jgi:hypothetical protein
MHEKAGVLEARDPLTVLWDPVNDTFLTSQFLPCLSQPLPQSQFSYPNDEVDMRWAVQDSQGVPGNLLPNAYLTVDENQYSR